MAAKSKRPSGDAIRSEEGSGMYRRATRRREDLMEEAQALRRAGKIRAAKGVESRVQQVDQLLGALESERQVGQKPH
jgi:hypothetical protein